MYELIVGGCSGSNTPAHSRPVYGHLTTSYGLLDRQNKRGIVIDNGTGVQVVARKMIKAGVQETTILQTHFHGDHLEGLQLNALLFSKTVQSIIVPRFENGRPFDQIFAERFHPVTWPVSPTTFGVQHNIVSFEAGKPTTLKLPGDVHVHTLHVNHPGGCIAYRFALPDGDIVIATDNELFGVGIAFCKRYAEFVSGANTLIADVQYTHNEYEGHTQLGGLAMSRKNWGHSTPEMLQVVLSTYCGVWPQNILLTHHDPSRTDDELKEFAVDAQAVNSKFQLLEPSR